jgi:hypothetical protein
LVTLLVVLSSTQAVAVPDEDAVARFLREFPDAIRRTEERFKSIRGKARIWYTETKQSGRLPESEATFLFGEGFEKVDLKRTATMGKDRKVFMGEVIYCVGERSGFRLSRVSGSKLYKVDHNGYSPSERSTYNSAFGNLAHASHSVLNMPLSRLLTLPNFRVLDATTSLESGRSLMEVRMEYGKDPAKMNGLIIVVEPEEDWRVRRWELTPGATPHPMIGRIEYDAMHGSKNLPRLVSIESASQGSTDHAEFSDWSFDPPSADEFQITRYELPPLKEPAPVRSYRTWWVVAIAIALFSVALVLRRLSQRRASEPQR